MLKQKIIFLLWLFLVIATFFSCGDINTVDDYEITISEPRFLVAINGMHVVSPPKLIEYKVSDTMIIMCLVKNPIFMYIPFRPIQTNPPIVARISSSETGDVQYVTFVPDPHYGWADGDLSNRLTEQPYIAYISPFKYNIHGELVSDPTRHKLKISPDGDMLAAEIKYKGQRLIRTIIVKGD